MKLEIDVRKSVFENANDYFQRAKKLRAKAAGAREALARAVQAAKPKPEKVQAKIPAKKRWYDAFRWFKTSEGLLVVAGKDASTNEQLVKKHLEPADIVFHADIAGAPFTVIKTGGKPAGEASLQQAAIFAASCSKAWKACLGSADVYWVTPDQLSKEAPAGEYVSKGAFIVRGTKNYLTVPLQLAFGNLSGELVWGPPAAVKAQTTKFVTLQPGDEDAKKLAERIKEKLNLGTSSDSIQRLIPAGKGRLA